MKNYNSLRGRVCISENSFRFFMEKPVNAVITQHEIVHNDRKDIETLKDLSIKLRK